MNCFPCFSSQRSKKETGVKDHDLPSNDVIPSTVPAGMPGNLECSNEAEHEDIAAQAFSFRELAVATKNFRQECLLGEGGFGRVYKGTLQATGQVVAVKQLDRNAIENKEFLVEVAHLSHLKHPNLVNLIGYCADGDQRLLVYEFMPGGTLHSYLYGMKAKEKTLDWISRMKIAYGAAQCLEYLHDMVNPPVIYRDLKSSNVLLDEQFNPKLSDIGLDKLGPCTSNMPLQSRVMGTYGYIAPEFSRSGRLTPIADVYSFGVVLLELITGRKAIDTTKPVDEQNLVAWAQPIFREPKNFPEMADPLLKKRFPERGLNQAVAIAAMCLQDEAAARPLMSDVVTALSFLSTATEENSIPPTLPASISSKLHCISTKLQMELDGSAKLKDAPLPVPVPEPSSDSECESDHDDQNDKESVSSSHTSSSSTHEDETTLVESDHHFSSLANNGSAPICKDGSVEASANSSAISQPSIDHAYAGGKSCSRDEHDLSDSLSQNSGHKSPQNLIKEFENPDTWEFQVISNRKERQENDAHSSSSSTSNSVDGLGGSSQKRNSKKFLEESSCNASSKKISSESRKSSDGCVPSMSRKSSRKSKQGNMASRNSINRKLPPDGSNSDNVSSSRRNSRKSPKKNHNSSKKATNTTTEEGSSNRKNRRRSYKEGKDSLCRSSSTGGLKDHESQVQPDNIRPQSATFTNADKTTF